MRRDCDGSNQSDPHLACAVAAPNATEVTREDSLPIGSLPPPPDLKVVKKRLPPFHGKNDGIWSWRLKEPTGEEERMTTEDAALEDAETALRKSGPTLESRAVEAHYRDEDPLAPGSTRVSRHASG
ncbi:hypothetical protein NDU88_001891 [Pleurodeles waltl]|uniref:Uncharacterized protein n=1 Tax=Pleurodeles waltl TaxID=8319 RepID=A0AAV7VD29_PLEWA|nr:hypothetical protein NDU88_001891 [Pleurodeles waltl]